ncbi:hypothetical protein FKP32DRAFT_1600631 [Trametes sanguinea]|nr:hypothetical protein FKP32DRAFT_1600631 [Trametes sanguinea]
MPLPNDATLTLQGQSRPGDPLHVKPKQAMLFRMSAETFEQLEGSQNPPRLEFEFGNTPREQGLYINDTFYPVTVNQENGPHELYLRMASAQKPMAPLKLYANVIGKFMVERQLGEKVEGSVRDRTLEAEKLRTERKTVYLDTPPDLGHPTAKGKSKKDAAAARRPAAASGSHSLSSARASRVASPLPGAGSHARGSSSDISMTRARLIHCLALRPRTTEAVIQLCAGKNPAPQLEEDLLSLLPKALPPIAPPTEHKPTPQFQKKSKEARAAEERREERQRERDRQAAAAAADEKPRVKSQGSPIPAASLSFKRKKLAQDGNDSEYSEREVPLSTSASKKRRLDEQQQQQQQRPPPDEKPRTAPRPALENVDRIATLGYTKQNMAERGNIDMTLSEAKQLQTLRVRVVYGHSERERKRHSEVTRGESTE